MRNNISISLNVEIVTQGDAVMGDMKKLLKKIHEKTSPGFVQFTTDILYG
jgi:hypothetical protein